MTLSVTVGHGTELTSRALEDWACRRGVKLDVSRPCKPTGYRHMESLEGRLRDEFQNVMQVLSIDDARAKIEACRTLAAKESSKSRRQADGEHEGFMHRIDRTVNAGTCTTAQRVRPASY